MLSFGKTKLKFSLQRGLQVSPGHQVLLMYSRFNPHPFHREYKIEVFAAEGVTKSQIAKSLEAKNTALETEFEMCVKFQIMQLTSSTSKIPSSTVTSPR